MIAVQFLRMRIIGCRAKSVELRTYLGYLWCDVT